MTDSARKLAPERGRSLVKKRIQRRHKSPFSENRGKAQPVLNDGERKAGFATVRRKMEEGRRVQ